MKNTLENLLQEAQQKNIGFSFNPITNQVNPTTGYMVSRQGYEQQVKSEDLVTIGLQYAELHKSVLANDNLYIGCWYNDGMFYLDISENIQTINVATSLALHYRQLTIWDCAKGQEYRLTSEGSWLYVKQRLEELRMALRTESMSYGELLELQCLSGYIDKGDVELLEASGVEESN